MDNPTAKVKPPSGNTASVTKKKSKRLTNIKAKMKSDERLVMPIMLGEVRKLTAASDSEELKDIEDKLSREVIRKNLPKGDIETPTEIPTINQTIEWIKLAFPQSVINEFHVRMAYSEMHKKP